MSRWPERVKHAEQAWVRFGPTATRMFEALWETDRPADEAVLSLSGKREILDEALRGDVRRAPRALAALIEEAAEVPGWVNAEQNDRAGRLLFRSAVAGGITLGARSLIGGYCAPAGNKPLALSGRLEEQGATRLGETARFVTSVCTAGSLAPFEEGWQICLRVRLMHAQVRALIERSGRWRSESWGAPLNQHDMVATSLLFSVVFIGGLRELGVVVEQEEADAYVQLWRYVAWLMGSPLELLPGSLYEAGRRLELVQLTQGPPDEDSRRLAAALLEAPRHNGMENAEFHVALGQGLCRALIGKERADALALPYNAFRHVPRISRAVLHATHALLPAVARAKLDERLVELGHRYWQRNMQQTLQGQPARFALPTVLRPRA